MARLTAVAMSGGLDSSVAAWILSRQEPPTMGLSMLLWDQSQVEAHGRCCGSLDLGDARRVAQQVGIPHYTLRLDREFRHQVVDPFVDDYLDGRTPSPCIRCNTWIKFDLFMDRARALGATNIATGHYARIYQGPEGPELHAALDTHKDQSYYLFELNQDQLAATCFPLGEMTKAQVRRMAREAGLTVAEKAESMEICFVDHQTGVRGFVEEQAGSNPQRFPQTPQGVPSQVVDSQGRLLGQGQPYYRYTVGQRRGLGIVAERRLYVLAVEPDDNQVVVGAKEELLAPGLVGERLHWIGPPPSGEVEATVKIRSRHAGVRSQIHCRRARPGQPSGADVEVEFEQPQPGIAPGQAAVFYQGSRVLGGCWIRRRLG